ncbi:hypothetical protein [Corynebacterium cystitidis]|uniref:hypothetical protein n=1 Tax=Corynebacterium cystitidis TaxID=35757 RepID=UPI00211F2A3E|nr:hypothetical protein [Corynebacterium cystitidis]
MNQRYEIDSDWIRDEQADGDGSSVSVRLTVTGPMAREGVLEWLKDLSADALGSRGRDGWLVREVKSGTDYAMADITAGGDDVEEGLRDGTEEAFDVLDPLGCQLEWVQLGQYDPKP